MTTLGGGATADVVRAALSVVAAFKDRPEREHLHEVQIRCLNELEDACRFLWEVASNEDMA